jgi:hypothetical protein
MPDLEITTGGNPMRVYSLLHTARPIALNFGAPGTLDTAAWSGRVQSIDARYEGTWELPGVGVVDAPAAVVVRPDGHVAWVGDGTDHGFREVLTRWFGAPAG